MKTFIFSCIVLIILICVVTCAGFYIQNSTETMLIMTSNLPFSLDEIQSGESEKSQEELEQALYDINIYWHKRRTIILLNLSHSETDKIDTAIAKLSAACISRDNGEYTVARALLLDDLIDLKESEALSVKGIL